MCQPVQELVQRFQGDFSVQVPTRRQHHVGDRGGRGDIVELREQVRYDGCDAVLGSGGLPPRPVSRVVCTRHGFIVGPMGHGEPDDQLTIEIHVPLPRR